ncbi:thiamine phosphate synthase [Oceanicella actignis]|uniref:thiamine phosphate synthase n=1 Tax=Oceanicella actignis TaxID=1189325 RepID=UPI0011E77778|nr:thiamine phosphate synthase [Oceanicella actignis]TYO89442.1 thiamine-phosphate pyrophosphorylase [Oceanicella actignis]
MTQAKHGAPAAEPRITLATPPRMEPERAARLLEPALDSGLVACVRIDMPGAEERALRAAAGLLRELCHARDVALILSDHFRLARALGLDGAQVDAARVRLRDAREALGPDLILGARCAPTRHAGMVAAEAGADYVLFAPVAPDPTLGDGAAATPELFEWWAEMIETPVVAEGGVDVALARRLGPSVDFVVPDPAFWTEDLPARLAELHAALGAGRAAASD